MVASYQSQRCSVVAAPCVLLRLIIPVILFCGTVLAEEQTDWATVAQNPMADVIRIPVENHFDFGYGHKEQVKYSCIYKPSMVAELSAHWNIVTRLHLPLVYQPGTVSGEKDSFGIGDTTYESFFGPNGKRTFYWGIGPAFQIPTATDNQLGTRKWSAGLAGTGTLVKGSFVAGVRANHLWSFAGKSDRPDVNLSTFEYYLYANLGMGWWIGTSPVNTADWEAASGEEWTIPVGGGFGKVVMNGRIPINLKLEAYSYTKAPSNSADWSLMLGIEFLFSEESLFKHSK